MADDAFFSFLPFCFDGAQADCAVFQDCQRQEQAAEASKSDHRQPLFTPEELEDFDPFSSPEGGLIPSHFGGNEDQGKDQTRREQIDSSFFILDDFQFQYSFPTTPVTDETAKTVNVPATDPDTTERRREIPSSLRSLRLLSDYGSKMKTMKRKNGSNNSSDANEDDVRTLSTEEIMRVAGARYVQHFSPANDHFNSPINHRAFGFGLFGLSVDETRDVELAHVLLAAAEKVGYQQFDRASKLLRRCEWISSTIGNPVQRIIFFFARALRERIETENGRATRTITQLEELKDSIQGLTANPTLLTCYQKIPFSQITHFAGIQVLHEHIATKKKVHLIDLSIRTGVQWTILMQALVDQEKGQSPIELLKISAVGRVGNQSIEETGKRLAAFANSLKLPFSFKPIFVSEMTEVKEESFEIEEDETVAIYAHLILRMMIGRPKCLERMMRAIRKLNPSLMVVAEVEANHCSPIFFNRFIEALFFYSAWFDCLETLMKQEKNCRAGIERVLGEGIRNIVAKEGEGRYIRNAKIEVWREFFARLRMEEIELSETSLDQASLMAKGFACGRFSTLVKNSKCLIVGWKGTPIISLSAWKFYCFKCSMQRKLPQQWRVSS